MPGWIAVVRRLLALYNVKTQAELTMAMGMAVNVGADGAIGDIGIPWKVLEKAVHDHGVDWNWLMTGVGAGPAIPPPLPPLPPPPTRNEMIQERRRSRLQPDSPYHLNTRELERRLLHPEASHPQPDDPRENQP